MSFLPLVRIWVWVSVLASVAGWLLSALGQLNEAGYAVFWAVGAVSLWFGRKALGLTPAGGLFNWRKVRARFRRWLPACFMGLALLVFLGGALYPPTTHTAMTYRTPRVLHWLAEGHWHWIHTPNYRMNNRCCGFEWLTAPVLLFLKTDRILFLLNFISFLLLPGLTFSVLTRLGIRPRVAWHWMWLLPTGYCFLLQAGSLGNDAFPAVYALAAVDFGLRAWESRRLPDLWLSVLSAALLTGTKATNLPLLLPWAVVVLPLLPWLLRRPAFGAPTFLSAGASNRRGVRDKLPGLAEAHCCGQECPRAGLRTYGATLALVLLAATVSFLPTAALNIRYCGDWSGLNIEHTGMNMRNPIVGIWGNALLLLKNFVPPFFPQASWWNQSAHSILPQAIVSRMDASFEGGYLELGEMPIEDVTGIGFGISWLLLISVLAAWRVRSRASDKVHPGPERRRPRRLKPFPLLPDWARLLALRCVKPARTPALRDFVTGPGVRSAPVSNWRGNQVLPHWLRWPALVAPWGSLLAYGMKSGIVDAGRLIAAYYPLLLALLLVGGGQAVIIRRRWWRAMAWGVVLLAVPVLVLTPGRPLWPAQTILSKLVAWKPGQRSFKRALMVYSVYDVRSDPVASVRALLPKGLALVGYMGTPDDIDISLWRPFGERRVEHILFSDSPEQIRKRHILYAVVDEMNLRDNHTTLLAWQQRTGAQLVATTIATQTVAQGPHPWYIVRFRD
jgi:hypothetical protein